MKRLYILYFLFFFCFILSSNNILQLKNEQINFNIIYNKNNFNKTISKLTQTIVNTKEEEYKNNIKIFTEKEKEKKDFTIF